MKTFGFESRCDEDLRHAGKVGFVNLIKVNFMMMKNPQENGQKCY